jgi:hypothetical protein
MTKARVNADNASADIQGVTAGTGLTGGGTSGTVTLDVDTTTIQARVANVTDTEIGYLDGVTSAIQTQLDAKIAKSLTTTTGDIIYASGANTPARLGIGSSGQLLTVTGGVPVWATPAGGGGAVVQVKSFATTSGTTTTSSSYQNTNQTLNITPTSASNKILVIATFNIYSQGNASIYDSGTAANLVRNSTELAATGSYWYTDAGGTARRDIGVPGIITYLDSPATTSAVTYKNQVKISMGSPVGASTFTPISITLMEVTP